jgi:DnaJ-class molecular chaperone
MTEVIQCKPIRLTTLDGMKLNIAVDQIMSPNSCKVVEGAGMPIVNKEGRDADAGGEATQRGALYILFDVEFPQHLTKAQKEKIESILE